MTADPGSAYRPALNQEGVSRVLEALGRAMRLGLPTAGVYVAEHGATVLVSTELAAARWREHYPHGTVYGAPLLIVHVDSIPSSAGLMPSEVGS